MDVAGWLGQLGALKLFLLSLNKLSLGITNGGTKMTVVLNDTHSRVRFWTIPPRRRVDPLPLLDFGRVYSPRRVARQPRLRFHSPEWPCSLREQRAPRFRRTSAGFSAASSRSGGKREDDDTDPHRQRVY